MKYRLEKKRKYLTLNVNLNRDDYLLIDKVFNL